MCSAVATEASVEPLSHTTISPSIPAAAKVRLILSMQGPIAASSFKHGMTTDTSGDWITRAPSSMDRSVWLSELPSNVLTLIPIGDGSPRLPDQNVSNECPPR
jgi:hypothetical protein